MKINEILKQLNINDIRELSELDLEDLIGLNDAKLAEEAFFVGDGLDVIRYLFKYYQGTIIRVPQVQKREKLLKRYIRQRKAMNLNISYTCLARETGMTVRTIRKYLKAMK